MELKQKAKKKKEKIIKKVKDIYDSPKVKLVRSEIKVARKYGVKGEQRNKKLSKKIRGIF